MYTESVLPITSVAIFQIREGTAQGAPVQAGTLATAWRCEVFANDSRHCRRHGTASLPCADVRAAQVSTAVIVFEMSGQNNLRLPLGLAVLIAHAMASRLTKGAYESLVSKFNRHCMSVFELLANQGLVCVA